MISQTYQARSNQIISANISTALSPELCELHASLGFRKQLARWGEKAKLGFPVNPHMLRHACGYALANRGMDTRSLQVTRLLGFELQPVSSAMKLPLTPLSYTGVWLLTAPMDFEQELSASWLYQFGGTWRSKLLETFTAMPVERPESI